MKSQAFLRYLKHREKIGGIFADFSGATFRGFASLAYGMSPYTEAESLKKELRYFGRISKKGNLD